MRSDQCSEEAEVSISTLPRKQLFGDKSLKGRNSRHASLTKPAIISRSNSKQPLKIRDKQAQVAQKQEDQKRSEFKDLTKRQNRMQINSYGPVSRNSKQQKHRTETILYGGGDNCQDRKLFQKTMEAIQSQQSISRMKQEIKSKQKRMDVAVQQARSRTRVFNDTTQASLNSTQMINKKEFAKRVQPYSA